MLQVFQHKKSPSRIFGRMRFKTLQEVVKCSVWPEIFVNLCAGVNGGGKFFTPSPLCFEGSEGEFETGSKETSF